MREAQRPLNVTIGEGRLAGKGVYAARAFEQGELVIPYALTELTQTEFDDLPPGEWEWTHSFHGRIYLFPEPERYVNHSDDPSTYPDHARGGNVALRSIRTGEAITIDDRRELQYELDTFLHAYQDACGNRELTDLAPLIADDAVYCFADGTRVGKAAIQNAFEDTRSGGNDSYSTLTDVVWVAANYWVSACTYTLTASSACDRERHTLVLRRLNGNWRVTHLHSSRAV